MPMSSFCRKQEQAPDTRSLSYFFDELLVGWRWPQ